MSARGCWHEILAVTDRWDLVRSIRTKPERLRNAPTSLGVAPHDRALASFFHSCDVLRVIVLGVTVLGWTDAQKDLEGVSEVTAVVAIESVGAGVGGGLRAQANIKAISMGKIR